MATAAPPGRSGRHLAALVASLGLAACASVPPPATRSPGNPAHPEAPEAATPPLSPMLMTEAEPAYVSPTAGPDPHAGHGMPMAGEDAPTSPARGASTGHEGHREAGPPAAGSQEASYACLMHPHVKSDKPGTCPVCGMALKQKPDGPNR